MLADRLWAKTERVGDCLEWTGTRLPRGYGVIYGGPERRKVYTHRAAYEVTHGPVPDGMYVCHKCDNPSCVEPDHLFLGSPADNMQDMRAKGRERYPSPGEAHPTAKLSDLQVEEIRSRYVREYQRVSGGSGWRSNAVELSEEFGISRSQVGRIVRHQQRNQGEHRE